jgi:hypothetical protein
MKQTVQMQRVQENMRPGIITLHGFLGLDSRNLVDILIDDDSRVKRLGLTHELIAERMEELRNEGLRGLGEFISLGPRFQVRVDTVRGKLPCPFEHPGLLPKTNITVRNLEMNREIFYSDVHIHLIRAHGFYEGAGSPFRLEPAELAGILEVIPEGPASVEVQM